MDLNKLFLLVIVLFLTVFLNAQSLRIVDISTLQPIENVAVFNLDHSKTALSNIKGITDIGEFDENDTLFFQHASYQDLILPYKIIEQLEFKIMLVESSVSLGEIVVSASKWEQKREEVPNKITSLKVSEVEFKNPQTSADLLSITNEVFIQKSQLGGGSPMIRGFAANSVLIVVDGVRMNNAIYRSGNLQNVISIDPNIVEDAEVIFGPGSIIYGSDALGGVMDFHTRKVKLSTFDSTVISSKAMARYSTANNEKTAHFDFNFGRRKWGFLTSVTYSDYEDLMMGSINHDEYQRYEYVKRNGDQDEMVTNTDPNLQIHSGYNQLNLLQKFLFKPSDRFHLNYTFQYSTSSDIPRYDRLIQYKNDSVLKHAEWYYGPQTWMSHLLNSYIKGNNKIFDEVQISLGYQAVEESRHDRKFSDNERRSRTENVDVITFNADFDKSLSEKNTLFYGVEGFYNYVGSAAESKNIENLSVRPASTRYPDGGSEYYSTALYANFKSNITTKLTLQTGARYTFVSTHSRFEDTTFYQFPYDKIELNTGAVNGSIGLVYRPSKKWQINTNLASGFRAPNIDDIAKIFDSEPGNVVVPNENLNPEYSYNIDLGFTRNFNEQAVLEMVVFGTWIDDMMVRRDYTVNGMDSIYYDGELSKVQAIVNAGSGWILGGNIAFRANLTERIGFTTNFTYLKGEDDQNDPIRHVTPMFGNTAFTYTSQKFKVELAAIYSGEISYKNLTSSERDKPYMYKMDENGNPYSPAWYSINLKGYYQFNPYVQLNIGLENLLDHRYRPYSSGIVAPGRNLILALRISI